MRGNAIITKVNSEVDIVVESVPHQFLIITSHNRNSITSIVCKHVSAITPNDSNMVFIPASFDIKSRPCISKIFFVESRPYYIIVYKIKTCRSTFKMDPVCSISWQQITTTTNYITIRSGYTTNHCPGNSSINKNPLETIPEFYRCIQTNANVIPPHGIVLS